MSGLGVRGGCNGVAAVVTARNYRIYREGPLFGEEPPPSLSISAPGEQALFRRGPWFTKVRIVARTAGSRGGSGRPRRCNGAARTEEG